MKKTVLTLGIIFILTNVFGQKTEFRLSFNSGLFSFAGKSTESTTFINSATNVPTQFNKSYTSNPYGSKNGFCYGISANVKRVTKWKFIYGVDLGYEMLRSKIAIDQVNSYISAITSSTTLYPTSGKININFSFINFQPFVGYRFALKQVHIDITAGLDIAHCLEAKEKGSAAASNGRTYTTSEDRKTITTDIRPRIQLSAHYKKFGVYVGYSVGQVNYQSGYIGSILESYSRILRFGVTYQL